MGYLYKPKGRQGKECQVYWCKWYRDGIPIRESTGSKKKGDAARFLALREGAKARGETLAPRLDRVTYTEVAADLLAHYERTGMGIWYYGPYTVGKGVRAYAETIQSQPGRGAPGENPRHGP